MQVDFKIFDKDGVWVRSIAHYPLVDPSPGSVARFEPGVPSKATDTEWLRGQPALKPCDDPTKTEEELAVLAAAAAAKAEADAAEAAKAASSKK